MSDRSLPTRLQESLGKKIVERFFSLPDDVPGAPPTRLAELIDLGLWWLGQTVKVEIRDTTTYAIDDTGTIDLGTGPGTRVLKFMRVLQSQNGGPPLVYDEVTQDWSEGTPGLRGAWYVKDRMFYAVGLGNNPGIWGPVSLYGWPPLYFNMSNKQFLVQGPIDVTYWGIPTEAQLQSNSVLLRAVLDYAVAEAFEEILALIMSPKRVKMEGVPEVFENVKYYQDGARMRKESAERLIGRYDVVMI